MKLQRERKIPNKPRFNYVTEKAYNFLLEHGYSTFPISPMQVLDDISEYVRWMPWSEAKKKLKCSDPFHLMTLGAEARTIRCRDNGLYLMIYDDVHYNSERRILWTLMHEIGHIVLGHLLEFEDTALSRGGLTKKGYEVLEIEAHYFAAEVMMPTVLMKYFHHISVEKMELLFGVSEEAAKKKYKRVFETSYIPDSPCEQKLYRNFFNYIENDVDKTIYTNIYGSWGLPHKSKYVPLCRKCSGCLSYVSDSESVFCPFCGEEMNKETAYRTSFQRFRDMQQFYKLPGKSHPNLLAESAFVDHGEESERVRICYNCLNHDISEGALYCNICGQPLLNYCEKEHKSLRLKEPYCSSCGSQTRFCSCYLKTEQRLMRIKDCSGQDGFSYDWMQYPFWAYIQMKILSPHSPFSDDLKSALLYSNAYITDDNDVVLYVDSVMAVSKVIAGKREILALMSDSDDTKYRDLEVKLYK